jgi:hypothetical protein
MKKEFIMAKYQKISNAGYRITRNGSIIPTIEKEAFKSPEYLGQVIKRNSCYYFFNRKQGNIYVYLP